LPGKFAVWGNSPSFIEQQPVVDGATVRMENRCRIVADGLIQFDGVEKGDDEKQGQSDRGSVW
jgi:hypothetical protein